MNILTKQTAKPNKILVGRNPDVVSSKLKVRTISGTGSRVGGGSKKESGEIIIYATIEEDTLVLSAKSNATSDGSTITVNGVQMNVADEVVRSSLSSYQDTLTAGDHINIAADGTISVV